MATPKFTTAVTGAALLTLLQFTGLSDVLWEHAPEMLRQLTVGGLQASANTFEGYIPPAGRGRVQRTDGASSRGCTNSSFGSISLLTPNDHVGLTVSSHPTFSWYVSAPTTAMQFALVEPGVSKPVLVKRLQIKKSGIVQLALPQNAPELSVGKAYRWTVSLVCNTKRPSENIYVRSWIARVTNKADEIQHLATATSERDRAMVYAQSGIWYDAITVISKAYLAHPKDRLTAEYLRLLLDQVGLSQVGIL